MDVQQASGIDLSRLIITNRFESVGTPIATHYLIWMPGKGLTERSAVRVHSTGPQTADQGEELTLAILRKPVLLVELPRVLVYLGPRLATIPAAIAVPFADEASHRISDRSLL